MPVLVKGIAPFVLYVRAIDLSIVESFNLSYKCQVLPSYIQFSFYPIANSLQQNEDISPRLSLSDMVFAIVHVPHTIN